MQIMGTEISSTTRLIIISMVPYLKITAQFFVPRLEYIVLEYMYIQQDDATCNNSRDTMEVLHGSFPGQFFSRIGYQNWLQQSCIITLMDLMLYILEKSQVNVNQPTTTQIIETENERCNKKNSMENFAGRVDLCHQSRGGLQDVLFHS